MLDELEDELLEEMSGLATERDEMGGIPRIEILPPNLRLSSRFSHVLGDALVERPESVMIRDDGPPRPLFELR